MVIEKVLSLKATCTDNFVYFHIQKIDEDDITLYRLCWIDYEELNHELFFNDYSDLLEFLEFKLKK